MEHRNEVIVMANELQLDRDLCIVEQDLSSTQRISSKSKSSK